METKPLNGKAIYQPTGAAGEYAKYACNFYVGCSNDCEYCYCKRGLLGHSMGKPQATLKKCFKNEEHALEVFRKELTANLAELRKHGLFFTFTSDPFLAETKELTIDSVTIALSYDVPCKILTKRADFVGDIPAYWKLEYRSKLAFGFTLTGCDELEPGASTNAKRIACMRQLHVWGFKTFASIEPIISLHGSETMILLTLDCCDLYKIGLMSGKRNYTKEQVELFCAYVNSLIAKRHANVRLHTDPPYNKPLVYWKDSVLKYLGESREHFCDCQFMVGADYNMFNH